MPPCDDYRIDMTASEFGLCKCGFKKALHSSTGLSRSATMPVRSGGAKKMFDAAACRLTHDSDSDDDGDSPLPQKSSVAAKAGGLLKAGFNPLAALGGGASSGGPGLARTMTMPARPRAADAAGPLTSPTIDRPRRRVRRLRVHLWLPRDRVRAGA